MNEQFLKLPEEKQQRIINAALEIFGKNEYKRASTDDIAAKAGISKGLLFYYFHNKKSLYLFLFDYSKKLVENLIMDESYREITDFFQLLEFGAREKARILEQNPYILEFVMRAFYSENETVSPDVKEKYHRVSSHIFQEYFFNIDFSRFREGINPMEAYQMLLWMSDGYLHQLQMFGQPLVLDTLMAEFRKWSALLKKVMYKEEYQDDCEGECN